MGAGGGNTPRDKAASATLNSLLSEPPGKPLKNLPASAGKAGSTPGLGRCPGEGNGYPLQYSCLGNPMDREAWWATVNGVTKSQTQLSNLAHTHTSWKDMEKTQKGPILPIRVNRVVYSGGT